MYENNERPKRESHVSAAIAGGVVGGIIVAIILVAVLYFTGTLGGGPVPRLSRARRLSSTM